MLDPKLSIPRVMVGGLVFGGVVAGCGDDGPSQASVVNEICAAYEDCEPEEFEEEYGSQAACRAEINRDLDEVVEEYGEGCRQAVLAYYACALPLYAACEDPEYSDACEAEDEALDEACGYDEYGY